MQLPFAEWTPDLPDHMNPGATEATNVFPAVNSYRPFNDIAVTSSNALTARCQGARAFKSDSGVVSIFAGDATKLYKLTSNAFLFSPSCEIFDNDLILGSFSVSKISIARLAEKLSPR